MSTDDEFEAVRRDPDPVRRGQRATSLLTVYQQRSTELARLRKAAIEEAHRQHGLSYTEIATRLGITKGRVTQIRSDAPRPERVFFGVGPVSIGIPYRYQTTDRERPLIAAEDAATGELLERLLAALAFAVTRYQIEPDREALPAGDSVVVCGPKSAPIAAELMSRDPALTMVQDEGRWWVEQQSGNQRFGSPSDEPVSIAEDIAYVARHRLDSRVIVHVAGIHTLGSLAAAHYLANHLGDLYEQIGDQSMSLVVRGAYQGMTITTSALVAGPFVW